MTPRPSRGIVRRFLGDRALVRLALRSAGCALAVGVFVGIFSSGLVGGFPGVHARAAQADSEPPAGPRPIELTSATLALLDRRPVLHSGQPSNAGAPYAAVVAAAPAVETLIDDFEAPGWPDRARWPLVADLDPAGSGASGAGHYWAPSECTASEGARALRAVAGGDGAALDCEAGYPASVASSALLYLDLRAAETASRLDLRFDAWLDADPDEGLMINYAVFDAAGRMAERHVLATATGRSRAWWRGMRLDLTALEDRLDPGWRGDLRGRRVYIEFLFVSHDGASDASGAFVDNVLLDVEIPPTPTATPMPSPTVTPPPSSTPTPPGPPVDRVNACRTISDCDALTVRSYVDYGCDGRFQSGVDVPVSGARITVDADAERLGVALGRTGFAAFRFPRSSAVEVSLAAPEGYRMCEGSPNPVTIEGRRFERTGRAAVSFRVMRDR